jgi:predicted amidohydrolase YtcJ
VSGSAKRTGLREAHAHIAAHGEALGMVNLAPCGSVGECLELVRRECGRARRERGDGRSAVWVRMMGARVEGWAERRWPTIGELDAASAGVACVLMSFDHHAACASTAAMSAAGLRAGEALPPNGVVCVDARGEATGLLLEQAAYRVWDAAPEPTEAQRGAHVAVALEDLARLGYAEVHDLHSQDWLGPLLARMDRAGELKITVWLYPPVARLEEVEAGRAAWESDRVRLAGGKLFADGTLNSRTALMLADYESPIDGMPHGRAMVSEGELRGAIELTHRLGLGLAVHAIGDGAVRMVLDAWERSEARGTGRGSTGGTPVPRLRVEHCELIDKADVPRFAELGVVCSVQPCHLLADIEVLRRYLPHRLDRVLPLRELIDSGCRPATEDGGRGLLWFGSDVPIVRADPGDSIVAATLRRREAMSESEAIGWGQRVAESEAWRCFGTSGTEQGRR